MDGNDLDQMISPTAAIHLTGICNTCSICQLDSTILKTLHFVNKAHWLKALDGHNNDDDEDDVPHSRRFV